MPASHRFACDWPINRQTAKKYWPDARSKAQVTLAWGIMPPYPAVISVFYENRLYYQYLRRGHSFTLRFFTLIFAVGFF
jgi:hypothetical protein